MPKSVSTMPLASPSARSCPTRKSQALLPSCTPSLLCQPGRYRLTRHDRRWQLLQSNAFRSACKALGLKHIRTKPNIPKTNGKAERFIQASLREWAYARASAISDDRAAELPAWLH